MPRPVESSSETSSPAEPTAATNAKAASSAVSNTSARATAGLGGSVAPAQSAPGAEGLREYRLALGREARRFKQEFDRRYDAIERERQRGWEGRVEMTVRSRTGLQPAVVLAQSSGFPPLDEQALELMGRAVRETAVPPALQGQAFALPVTLEFRIRQE